MWHGRPGLAYHLKGDVAAMLANAVAVEGEEEKPTCRRLLVTIPFIKRA
jgi:hypothetical protein